MMLIEGEVVGGDQRQIKNLRITAKALKELCCESNDPAINDPMKFLEKVIKLSFHDEQQSGKEKRGIATNREFNVESSTVLNLASWWVAIESQIRLEIVDADGAVELDSLGTELKEAVKTLKELLSSKQTLLTVLSSPLDAKAIRKELQARYKEQKYLPQLSSDIQLNNDTPGIY